MIVIIHTLDELSMSISDESDESTDDSYCERHKRKKVYGRVNFLQYRT